MRTNLKQIISKFPVYLGAFSHKYTPFSEHPCRPKIYPQYITDG